MHNMYFYLHSYCHFKYKTHDAKKRNASLFHFSILFKLFFYNLCSSPYSFVFRIGKQIENKYEEKRSSMSIHNTPTITTGFFPCHPVLHIHSSFEPPLQCSSLPPPLPPARNTFPDSVSEWQDEADERGERERFEEGEEEPAVVLLAAAVGSGVRRSASSRL